MGDGWLVAWTRVDIESLSDPAVGYAVVGADGTVSRAETIENASQHTIAQAEQAVVLAYHDRNGGQLRRDTVTQNDRTTETTYDLADDKQLNWLTVSETATAWGVGSDQTRSGFYAEGDTVEELSFVDRTLRLRSATLRDTAAGTVLSYLRAPDGDLQTRRFAYRLRADGEWRPEQTPAGTDPDGDLLVRQPAVTNTLDGNGVTTLLAAKPRTSDGVSDLFAVDQPLRPNYAVSASSEAAMIEPGEDVTVAYTVENTGDVDGSVLGENPVPVEARSQGETLAETTVDPLDREETVSGELTLTLDETGTVDIVAGRALDLLAADERRETVEVSTPALGAPELSVERPTDDTAVATISLRNSGPIDAEAVEIAVETGAGRIAETVIDGIPAGERVSATVEYDPGVLALNSAETLLIDPDGALPGSHVPAPTSSVLLGQPDILVSENVKYFESELGVTADILTTNTGPIRAKGSVRAVAAGAVPEDGRFNSEDVLGTAQFEVPPAVGGTGRSTRISIPLVDVEEGQEIRFVSDLERSVADAGVPVVYDEVGSLLPDPDPEPAIPPIVGDNPPRDLNDDGLYEDVTGDGQFTVGDVQALFIQFVERTDGVAAADARELLAKGDLGDMLATGDIAEWLAETRDRDRSEDSPTDTGDPFGGRGSR